MPARYWPLAKSPARATVAFSRSERILRLSETSRVPLMLIVPLLFAGALTLVELWLAAAAEHQGKMELVFVWS